MKKIFTPLNIVFALEVLSVFLASAGLIPREAVLIWTGLAIFYLIFSSLDDGLWLIIASIPLAVALPLTANFDTMANWRILVAVLFLSIFFKKRIWADLISCFKSWECPSLGFKHHILEWLAGGFLVIAVLSIGVAAYPVLAIKKILFLVNIFLLFFIIGNIVRSKVEILRVWQAAAVGGVAVIVAALIQFFGAIFFKLYSFWQFWADSVIKIFYGDSLSQLLAYANSWFAYYKSAPPTLRLFSVFPDSHSFAMFSLILMPILLALALYFEKKTVARRWFWALASLTLFGIIFSGSRGAWLSLIPVAAVAIYFFSQNIERPLFKKALVSFLIFGLFFCLSTAYQPLFYKIHAWQTGEYGTSTFSFFERARSISDLDELSNKSRLQIWGASLKSIVHNPWLGVGLGNYVEVLGEDVAAAKKGASAHNLYLDFTSEVGVPGALIVIFIFGEILRTSWLVFRRSRDQIFKFYGLIFGLYFLWIALYSLFDVVLLNDKVLLLFMVAVATLYSIKDISLGLNKKMPSAR